MESSVHAQSVPPSPQAPEEGRARSSHLLPRRFLSLLHAALSAGQGLTPWLQTNTSAPHWLPARWRHPWISYLLALGMSAFFASITLLLTYLFPALNPRGVLLIGGIVLVALTWGAGPSLLATFFSVWLLESVVLPPHFSWQPSQPSAWVDGGLHLVSWMGVSLLASQSGWARRRAEALAGSLSAAKASSDLERQHLRTLLEVLPVPVVMVDSEGRFLENTPAGKTIWGNPASWARELAEVPPYPAWRPDTGQPVARDELPLVRALTTGESTLNEELEFESFDGQRHILLNSATPTRDETGAIRGAVGVVQDITGRKRLEEALRQAEREAAARARELEAIFEALTDGLLVYDAQGRILRSNIAARQLLGFEAHPEFASLPWKERAIRYAPLDAEGQSVLPKDLALSRLLRGEVLTGAHTAEDSLHTPDGREVAFSMTGRPLRTAAGEIIGAVGIARDETERRRLEREVAERAAQLEAIFESIADGVVVTDHEGRVLHLNAAYRTLLELEGEPKGVTLLGLQQLAGHTLLNEQGDPITEAERPVNRILQGEVLTGPKHVNLLLRTRAGREVHINGSGALIRDPAGHRLGAVQVIRDVTEQRRLEQQTRSALEALLAMAEALVQAPGAPSEAPSEGDPALPVVARRLAELTRSVLGFESVSMVAVDPATEQLTPITIVGFSPEHEQQWWASWDRPFRLDERLPPHLAARLRSGEPGLIESTQQPEWWHPLFAEMTSLLVPMHMGDTLVGVLRLEEQRLAPAGTRQQEKAVTLAVARLGALVLERERLLRDRTEAQASELALRETQAQMETFLGMAGHELKNPLTSLKLALQLAERRLRRLVPHEPDTPHDLAPFLDQLGLAAHQATRLERLVNELLDVSRVRAGKLDLRPEPADLAAIVGEAVEEQRQINPTRTLVFASPAGVRVPVWADADRIGQVVTNYLTNALKYSPAARPVTVGLDVDEQQARVWVRDQGPGLPPEEQERIWERFHRVNGIEVQSGTGVGLGLGLHICRTIIERHQGQVGVQSAPGQGSTFWFRLKLAGEPEERGPARR